MPVSSIPTASSQLLVFACVACTGGETASVGGGPAAGEPLTGPYLGQNPPGLEPELFAPGVVSTGLHEFSINVSPSGNEIYFYATGPTYSPRMILHSRLEGGVWSPPREVEFADPGRADLYPFVTRDGNRLFFCSSAGGGGAGGGGGSGGGGLLGGDVDHRPVEEDG